MSIAPSKCMYCDGDGYNSRANTPCGFCLNGVPLDIQSDWDNSWGKVIDRRGLVIECARCESSWDTDYSPGHCSCTDKTAWTIYSIRGEQ